MKTETKNKLLNLTEKGVSLYVPFLKQLISENMKLYNSIDGYQAAIISMNLNPYIKLSLTQNDIAPSDQNFLNSFNLILKDQELLISKAFSEFDILISKYLEDKDSPIEPEVFKSHLFRDPGKV